MQQTHDKLPPVMFVMSSQAPLALKPWEELWDRLYCELSSFWWWVQGLHWVVVIFTSVPSHSIRHHLTRSSWSESTFSWRRALPVVSLRSLFYKWLHRNKDPTGLDDSLKEVFVARFLSPYLCDHTLTLIVMLWTIHLANQKARAIWYPWLTVFFVLFVCVSYI